jgi:hypothetical protein
LNTQNAEKLNKEPAPAKATLRQKLQNEIDKLPATERSGTSNWISYEANPHVEWKMKVGEHDSVVMVELAGLRSAKDWPDEGSVLFSHGLS